LAGVGEVATGPELAARAVQAEQLGYYGVVVPDHLIDQLSPVVAMATVAAATSTLRVSAFVLNNDL
jgi:alkanesulfonate monooxygenase SsuD/methylene tetrahydromethanopterin reductase-like flavin-dependent oxidoreductase (luciferase family)